MACDDEVIPLHERIENVGDARAITCSSPT